MPLPLNDPCPLCAKEESAVTDSRPHPLGRTRRRRCEGCGYRWTTMEMPIMDRRSAQQAHVAMHAAMVKLHECWTALEAVRDLMSGTPVQEGHGEIGFMGVRDE